MAVQLFAPVPERQAEPNVLPGNPLSLCPRRRAPARGLRLSVKPKWWAGRGLVGLEAANRVK